MTFNPETLYADRIGGERFGKDTTVYKFAKIKAAKAAFIAENSGVQIIDLGVGEHDGIAPEEVRETLAPFRIEGILQELGYKPGSIVEVTPQFIHAVESRLQKGQVHNPANRGYADNGILEFQQAAASYLNAMLGTSIPTGEDAQKHILHGIGSKGILSLLPLCFVNPDETTIMTVPGYPVLGTHARYLGGIVENVSLTAENGFLPDLGELDEIVARSNEAGNRVKILCLNYPNNPTGTDAPVEFWEGVAKLAHKHNFVVVHDAAYAELKYSGKPTGILQVDGGMECGLGVYSLSKAFNMIGYRLAFVAGNPALIAAYGNVKDNTDSGQAKMMQMAGVAALNKPELSKRIVAKYQRRLEGLIEVLNRHGFSAKMPDGSFFLYTESPTGTKDGKQFETAEDASQHMLLQEGISVVPWDDTGKFIRFSATFEAGDNSVLDGTPEEEKKVFEELDARLERLQLKFK